MEFELDLDLKLLVEVLHYIPERLPPICRNPSSPKFSDDGDKEEMEYNVYFMPENNEPVLMPNKILDFLRDDIEKEIREREEIKYE